jgi:predicted lactoylglutathione lyase
MAKLLGPDFINLQVRDLSASRVFYTEVLGLTVDPQFDTPEVFMGCLTCPSGLEA